MGGTYHNKGRGVPGIGRAKAPKSTILWALVGVLAVYALIAQRGTFSSGDQGGTNQGRVVSSGAVVRQSSDLEEVRLWPAEGSRKEAQTKPKERWTQKKKAAGGGRMLDHLPHTYFDIEIAGVPKGRIVFALYSNVSHLAAENFRALCTGEKGVVPAGAGQTYWFKGWSFYRIIDRFIDQTCAGTESIFGGKFKDDPGGLRLKHDRPGLLSMANFGPDTNTSHYSILMAPAPHLDGSYVIFGEVVSGMDLAWEINALSSGKPENTAGPEVGVKIVGAGECKTTQCL